MSLKFSIRHNYVEQKYFFFRLLCFPYFHYYNQLISQVSHPEHASKPFCCFLRMSSKDSIQGLNQTLNHLWLVLIYCSPCINLLLPNQKYTKFIHATWQSSWTEHLNGMPNVNISFCICMFFKSHTSFPRFVVITDGGFVRYKAFIVASCFLYPRQN